MQRLLNDLACCGGHEIPKGPIVRENKDLRAALGGGFPPDALFAMIMKDILGAKELGRPESDEAVETFDEAVKLKNGKYGLKISRSDKFILNRPIPVLNNEGLRFNLLGFIRKNRKSKPYWIMTNGRWFNDEYFYIETEEPRVKITLAEVEARLGFKVEIVG